MLDMPKYFGRYRDKELSIEKQISCCTKANSKTRYINIHLNDMIHIFAYII